MEKKHQFNAAYLVIALWGILLFQYLFGPASQRADISYSEFEQYLADDKVQTVAVDDRYIHGIFKQPQEGKTRFITPRMEVALAERLAQHDVEFTGIVEDTFLATLISWVAPTLIFLFGWFFLFRKFADARAWAA